MNNPSDISIREYIYYLVDWTGIPSILDLGCGDGFDLRRIEGTLRQHVLKNGVYEDLELYALLTSERNGSQP